jgi:hypothetical protein
MYERHRDRFPVTLVVVVVCKIFIVNFFPHSAQILISHVFDKIIKMENFGCSVGSSKKSRGHFHSIVIVERLLKTGDAESFDVDRKHGQRTTTTADQKLNF